MARRKRWKQSRASRSTVPVTPSAAEEVPTELREPESAEPEAPEREETEREAAEPEAPETEASATEPAAVAEPEIDAAPTQQADPLEGPTEDTVEDGADNDVEPAADNDAEPAADNDVEPPAGSEDLGPAEAEETPPEPQHAAVEADSEPEQPVAEDAQAEVESQGAAEPVSDDAAHGEPTAAVGPVPEPEPEPEEAEPREASPAAYDLTTTAADGTPTGPVEGVAAWRRLLLVGRPRATKANILAGVLAVALGIGIATQVQLTNERGLSELSQTDLVRVLDDISLRSSQLDEHIRELEATRDRLRSGTDTTAEAMDQAQRRIDTLGILAGTIAAQGPGITVDISDPDRQVTGPLILDLIQELRDAGAESIEVGGVRVVASTFIGDSGGDLTVDGKPITRPIHIKAIGDSNTLASAMTIPGGIVETIRQKGARASVNEAPSIEIRSVHRPKQLTHARPSE